MPSAAMNLLLYSCARYLSPNSCPCMLRMTCPRLLRSRTRALMSWALCLSRTSCSLALGMPYTLLYLSRNSCLGAVGMPRHGVTYHRTRSLVRLECHVFYYTCKEIGPSCLAHAMSLLYLSLNSCIPYSVLYLSRISCPGTLGMQYTLVYMSRNSCPAAFGNPRP